MERFDLAAVAPAPAAPVHAVQGPAAAGGRSFADVLADRAADHSADRRPVRDPGDRTTPASASTAGIPASERGAGAARPRGSAGAPDADGARAGTADESSSLGAVTVCVSWPIVPAPIPALPASLTPALGEGTGVPDGSPLGDTLVGGVQELPADLAAPSAEAGDPAAAAGAGTETTPATETLGAAAGEAAASALALALPGGAEPAGATVLPGASQPEPAPADPTRPGAATALVDPAVPSGVPRATQEAPSSHARQRPDGRPGSPTPQGAAAAPSGIAAQAVSAPPAAGASSSGGRLAAGGGTADAAAVPPAADAPPPIEPSSAALPQARADLARLAAARFNSMRTAGGAIDPAAEDTKGRARTAGASAEAVPSGDGAGKGPGRGGASGAHAGAAFTAASLPGPGLAIGRQTPAQATGALAAPIEGELATDLERQIVQTLKLQWGREGGDARIRLQPGFLGDLTISLRVEHGTVTAQLAASTPDVRRWIETHEAVLRQGLAQHALTLDRLVVVEEEAAATAEQHPPADHGDEPASRRRRPARAPKSDATFEVVV